MLETAEGAFATVAFSIPVALVWWKITTHNARKNRIPVNGRIWRLDTGMEKKIVPSRGTHSRSAESIQAYIRCKTRPSCVHIAEDKIHHVNQFHTRAASSC